MEYPLQGWFSNNEILRSYFKNFVSNKYLGFKIWCQKSDSILDSKGRDVCEYFQENSKK